MKKQAVIYGIKGKSTDIFYIGSTLKTAEERLRQHLKHVEKDRHHNQYFARKVRKLGAENIEIIVLQTCAAHKRFTKEYALIDQYDKKGFALTNLLRFSEHSQFARHSTPNREIPWPHPVQFIIDVQTFVSTPKEQWIQHSAVHTIRHLLLDFLHAHFIEKSPDLRLFMRDYLGAGLLKDLLQYIRKSPIYNELRNFKRTTQNRQTARTV